MARRSQWEHLKEEIMQHCREGKKPKDLYPMYPQVPPKTIRNWYDAEFAPESPEIRLDIAQNSPSSKTVVVQSVEVIPPTEGKLVALDGGEQLSDFALARRALRDVIKNPTKPGSAIKVQASFGLMRLTQLRAELPKSVIDEIEVTGIDEERDKIGDLPLEDLQQEYKKLVNE